MIFNLFLEIYFQSKKIKKDCTAPCTVHSTVRTRG